MDGRKGRTAWMHSLLGQLRHEVIKALDPTLGSCHLARKGDCSAKWKALREAIDCGRIEGVSSTECIHHP